MTLAHRYNEFQEDPTIEDLNAREAESAEESLRAFENGYQAGWQDAASAHDTEQERLLSELVQCFQVIQFTYQDARNKLILDLRPIAKEFLEKIFPGVSRASLRANLSENIGDIVSKSTRETIEISASPNSLKEIQELLKDTKNIPIILTENTGLAPMQVSVKVSQSEKFIDINDICDQVLRSLEAFSQQSDSGDYQ